MKKHIRIKAASCLDMINAFQHKISELDPNYVESAETIDASACEEKVGASCNDKKTDVTAEEYIQGADGEVDETYVDEMMQYVADETVISNDAVCSWRVEDDMLIFVLAGLNTDFVDEYSCPLTDLTGDIDTDMDYILSAINNDEISEEEIV